MLLCWANELYLCDSVRASALISARGTLKHVPASVNMYTYQSQLPHPTYYIERRLDHG